MNSKGKGSVDESTQMKVGRGSGIIENNRSRKGVKKNIHKSVEYSTINHNVTTAFTIIFGMCKRESI
jgi:hypothetical protein